MSGADLLTYIQSILDHMQRIFVKKNSFSLHYRSSFRFQFPACTSCFSVCTTMKPLLSAPHFTAANTAPLPRTREGQRWVWVLQAVPPKSPLADQFLLHSPFATSSSPLAPLPPILQCLLLQPCSSSTHSSHHLLLLLMGWRTEKRDPALDRGAIIGPMLH